MRFAMPAPGSRNAGPAEWIGVVVAYGPPGGVGSTTSGTEGPTIVPPLFTTPSAPNAMFMARQRRRGGGRPRVLGGKKRNGMIDL